MPSRVNGSTLRDLFAAWERLMPEFREMGQIKTNFDSEKFTAGKEGRFIACQFHMLMRQYRLYMQQTIEWMIEYEELKRKREFIKKEFAFRRGEGEYSTSAGAMKLELRGMEHLDLEDLRCQNQMQGREIDIWGRLQVMQHFEKLRIEIIRQNDGKVPTNEEFQAEQPEYYHWFLQSDIFKEILERNTGIRCGTTESALQSARKPILPGSSMQTPPFFAENGSPLPLELPELVEQANLLLSETEDNG